MQKKEILVDNQIISYIISENFNKDHCVLFLHGWGQNKNSFDKILKLYESKNKSFLSIDFPGFGQSPKPKEDWFIKDYANIVQKLLKKLDIESIDIVSHSFGGRIAIYMSANNIFNINKQILIASGGIKPKQNKLFLYFVKTSKILLSILPQNLQNKLKNKFRSQDYKNAKELEKIFLNTINFDLRPYLKDIKVPTKLIWGTDDDQTPISDAYTMNNEISKSELFIIQGGSHFIHIENSEIVSEEIDKFLSY